MNFRPLTLPRLAITGETTTSLSSIFVILFCGPCHRGKIDGNDKKGKCSSSLPHSPSFSLVKTPLH